jgi:hypothetical protein
MLAKYNKSFNSFFVHVTVLFVWRSEFLDLLVLSVMIQSSIDFFHKALLVLVLKCGEIVS